MTSKSRGLPLLMALFLACACSLAAQSKMPEDLGRGKILVAPRGSTDPIFAKSVILLVRYDKTGALGFMLNHRTAVPISRALPGVEGAAKRSNPVFLGGPVQMGAVFALVRAPAKPAGAREVIGHVYFVSAKSALEKALNGASNPGKVRIYLGYCGWGAGQLDAEVQEGRWYIFDGNQALAFDAKPATLWSRLIGKTEQRFAQLAMGLPIH